MVHNISNFHLFSHNILFMTFIIGFNSNVNKDYTVSKEIDTYIAPIKDFQFHWINALKFHKNKRVNKQN